MELFYESVASDYRFFWIPGNNMSLEVETSKQCVFLLLLFVLFVCTFNLKKEPLYFDRLHIFATKYGVSTRRLIYKKILYFIFISLHKIVFMVPLRTKSLPWSIFACN